METTSAAAASTSTTSSEGCVCHVHTAPPVTPSSVLLRRRRLLIALGALLVALATAAALRNGQALLTWDVPIQQEVEANRTSALNDLFLAVSRLGSTVFVLIAGSLGAILTWRRCRAVATALLVATFARPAIEFIVKGNGSVTSVRTTMPSFTGVLHAIWSFGKPSISTWQSRQDPSMESFGCQQ